MGYHTSIYAVDLQRLRSAFGSNDTQLLDEIAETCREAFAESNEWFATEIANGALTREAALAELIRGTLSAAESSAFQYGYALETLCRHVGTQLETDMLGEIGGIGLADELATSGPPVPIPPPDDFPVMGYLTHQQAAAELHRIAASPPSHPEPSVRLAIEQLRSCLEHASRQRVDLVAFCA